MTDIWMPCQDQGLASEATSIYLGSGANSISKIMFPPKNGINSNSFDALLEFFSNNHQRNGKN